MLLYSERGLEGLPESVRHRSVVVGNTQFRTQPGGGRDGRSRAGGRDRLAIIHVGQLRADRGLELGLEALAELNARGWDSRLVIVGDGPARGDLERRARELGLETRVEFAGATHDDGEIRALYGRSDVATFGALGGLGVVDALEHAVPVVLWGKQSSQPPEADIVYEWFPDLVDVDATPAGVALRGLPLGSG